MASDKVDLFNKYEVWTEEACKLANEFRRAVKPIFLEAAKKYRSREIQVIYESEISMLVSEYIMRGGIARRKEEKSFEAFDPVI